MARGVVLLVATLASLVPGCAAHPSRTAAGASRALGSRWTFHDEDDRAVTLSDYRGSALLATMIYTSCERICPRTVDKLRHVEAAFVARGRPVQVALITLDPRTDTPQRLKAYKASHRLRDNWHLLRASEHETAVIARTLGVHRMEDDTHIDHDVRIAVLDASGRLVRELSGWGFDDSAAIP